AGPRDVSFLANPRYARFASTTKAAAIICSPREAEQLDGRTLLVAKDAYFAFRQAVVALHGWRRHPAPGISELACIDPTATIGEDCTIQPFVYIAAGARIGKRCVIYPHCYI